MSDTIEPVLALPQSRIELLDGHIVKMGKNNIPIARHPLREISDIDVQRPIDPFGVTMFFASLVGAALCRLYFPSVTWGWVGAIFFGIVALLSLLAIHKDQIRIKCNDGTVTYPLMDNCEEAQGFALTIRSLSRQIAGGNCPAWAGRKTATETTKSAEE